MNDIRELLILHHTHTDIGYTHPQPVIWELHKRYIDEALDLCEQTSDWPDSCRMKWTCEVTSTVLHWLDRSSPAQIRRMQNLVRNGQIAFGAMWCNWTALTQEDVLLESLRPLRRLRELFETPISVALQHDVNGIPWSAVDQLLDAGVPNIAFAINIHMGGFPMQRPMLFHWAGPSGRTLTVFSGEHYNTFSRETDLKNPDLNSIQAGLQRYFQKLRAKKWTHDFAYLTATHPFMDDNNPPNPALPGLIRRWNEEGRTPFIRMVTPEQLFDRVHTLGVGKFPVYSGDWTDYWTNGVASSALDVAVSRRAHGALWSARALTALKPDPAIVATQDEAAWNLALADEHTWNVFSSTAAFGPSRTFEPVPEAEQRVQKSAYCCSALSLARMARRDALDALAANPVQSIPCEGLMVFNPAQSRRRVCLRIPNDVLAGGHPLIAGTKHRLDVMEDLHNDASATWVGPLDLEPLALASWPMAELPRANVVTGVAAGPDTIESLAWRLTFDPSTGAVRSLIHLPDGAECFDGSAGWDFFGPVRETVAERSPRSVKVGDPRFDLFQVSEDSFEIVHNDNDAWNHAWNARREKPESSTRVETRINAEGVHLVRTCRIAGVNGPMVQTISLLAHEPRIRFEAYFNKGDVTDPESLYFTFPFHLPGAQMHFDTAGQDVAWDREQLQGVCRDWITAGSWVAAASPKGCLILACPDAPLFQVGGFQYARGLRSADGINQALLVAWPMNNYWNTNFRASQPGFIRLRYELAHLPKYDAAACADFGASCERQPVWHPLSGRTAPIAAQLPSIEGEGLSIVSIRPVEGGCVLSLRNHRAESRRAVVHAGAIKSAALVDGLDATVAQLEVRGGRVEVDLPPRRTIHIALGA